MGYLISAIIGYEAPSLFNLKSKTNKSGRLVSPESNKSVGHRAFYKEPRLIGFNYYLYLFSLYTKLPLIITLIRDFFTSC